MTRERLKKALGYTAIVFVTVLWFAVSIWLGGCSVLNTAQSAPANQTMTEIIADAGAAATSAEQQYQAGTIPQNEYSRAAINDLGNAYNDARAAYTAVLTAEIQYHAAVNTQLASCAPPAVSSSGATTAQPKTGPSCTDATAHATQSQTTLNNANFALSQHVSVLTSKISVVKALQPKN